MTRSAPRPARKLLPAARDLGRNRRVGTRRRGGRWPGSTAAPCRAGRCPGSTAARCSRGCRRAAAGCRPARTGLGAKATTGELALLRASVRKRRRGAVHCGRPPRARPGLPQRQLRRPPIPTAVAGASRRTPPHPLIPLRNPALTVDGYVTTSLPGAAGKAHTQAGPPPTTAPYRRPRTAVSSQATPRRCATRGARWRSAADRDDHVPPTAGPPHPRARPTVVVMHISQAKGADRAPAAGPSGRRGPSRRLAPQPSPRCAIR